MRELRPTLELLFGAALMRSGSLLAGYQREANVLDAVLDRGRMLAGITSGYIR